MSSLANKCQRNLKNIYPHPKVYLVELVPLFPNLQVIFTCAFAVWTWEGSIVAILMDGQGQRC